MGKVLILLLTLCAFTAAMVPREKRAVNTEEKSPTTATEASSTKNGNSSEICQPNTPCAWSIDKPYTFITNSYCICGPGTECVVDEDDKAVNAYVHRCRAPGSTSYSESGTR